MTVSKIVHPYLVCLVCQDQLSTHQVPILQKKIIDIFKIGPFPDSFFEVFEIFEHLICLPVTLLARTSCCKISVSSLALVAPFAGSI